MILLKETILLKNKKTIIIFTTLICLSVNLFSQNFNLSKLQNEDLSHSSEMILNNKYNNMFNNLSAPMTNQTEEEITYYKPTIANRFTAFGEGLASNLVLMGVNRFIRKAPYSYISWDSMHTNLTNPWVWDQDEFHINHLGHPYQGSFYFTAARSNNLSFWESILYTMAGSALWEVFAEIETPSYNDLLVTTIGGASLGEMMHRIYFQVADLSKILAFVVSPMHGINDLIWSGRLNRPTESISELSTKILFGGMFNKTYYKNSTAQLTEKVPFYGGAEIDLIYGEPYALQTKTPFSQFDFNVRYTITKDYNNLSLFSNGFLWSFAPWEQDKLKTTMGISLHYDYLYTSGTNFSQNAIGFTTKQHVILPHNWDLKWDLHLNYIMMAATDYYYLFNKIIGPGTDLENRLYDLGYGAGIKTSLSLSNPKAGTLNLSYFLDWTKTINKSLPNNGSRGSSLIGIGSISYEHQVYKSFSIGAEYSSYMKNAFYKDAPGIFEYNQSLNIYLKNRFL